MGSLPLLRGGPPRLPADADPLEPAYAIVYDGPSAGVSDAKQQAPSTDWTELAPLTEWPGSPTHYRVYEGGGEGDCAVDALEFQVDRAIHTRLFFQSACYGDTSEETLSPASYDADTFTLRSEHSFVADAEMNDDGTWTGRPARRVADRVYRWTSTDGLTFVEERVVESTE